MQTGLDDPEDIVEKLYQLIDEAIEESPDTLVDIVTLTEAVSEIEKLRRTLGMIGN